MMIPSSYLYKDAFEQHWGKHFARRSVVAWEEDHLGIGQWQLPSPFRAVRDLVTLAFAPTRRDAAAGGDRLCPEGAGCPSAA